MRIVPSADEEDQPTSASGLSARELAAIGKWRPWISERAAAVLLILYGFGNLIFAFYYMSARGGNVEVDLEYARAASASSDKTFEEKGWIAPTLTVPARMEPPILLFYELAGFHQNHRRYVRSFEEDQYRGNLRFPWNTPGDYVLTPNDLPDSCLYIPHTSEGRDGRIRLPCGLVPSTVFNDTFIIERKKGDRWERVELDETPASIVWQTEHEERFVNADPEAKVTHGGEEMTLDEAVDIWVNEWFPPVLCVPKVLDGESTAYARDPTTDERLGLPRPRRVNRTLTDGRTVFVSDCQNYMGTPTCTFDPPCEGDFEPVANPAGWGLENSHFMSWARPAPHPEFRKLYAKISKPLDAKDELRITINSIFPVDLYEGSKSIVLFSGDLFTGNGSTVDIVYGVVGVLAILYGVLVIIHDQSVRSALTSVVELRWKDS
jgi:hypothetical protein